MFSIDLVHHTLANRISLESVSLQEMPDGLLLIYTSRIISKRISRTGFRQIFLKVRGHVLCVCFDFSRPFFSHDENSQHQ